MAKRTIIESPIDAVKTLKKKERREYRSGLPRGYLFVERDGKLYVKSLKTGKESMLVE